MEAPGRRILTAPSQRATGGDLGEEHTDSGLLPLEQSGLREEKKQKGVRSDGWSHPHILSFSGFKYEIDHFSMTIICFHWEKLKRNRLQLRFVSSLFFIKQIWFGLSHLDSLE